MCVCVSKKKPFKRVLFTSALKCRCGTSQSKKEQDFSQTSYLSYSPSAKGPLTCTFQSGLARKVAPKQPRTDRKSVKSPVTPVHSSPSCRLMLGAFIEHTLVHRSSVNAAVAATRCLSPQKGQMSVFRNNNLKKRVLCTYFFKKKKEKKKN